MVESPNLGAVVVGAAGLGPVLDDRVSQPGETASSDNVCHHLQRARFGEPGPEPVDAASNSGPQPSLRDIINSPSISLVFITVYYSTMYMS